MKQNNKRVAQFLIRFFKEKKLKINHYKNIMNYDFCGKLSSMYYFYILRNIAGENNHMSSKELRFELNSFIINYFKINNIEILFKNFLDKYSSFEEYLKLEGKCCGLICDLILDKKTSNHADFWRDMDIKWNEILFNTIITYLNNG